jgi:hypothetical protein
MQGGFLHFSSKVPSVAAAQFNFVADGRIGAKILLRSGQTMSVAYVFHHLSNGFEARNNPGVAMRGTHLMRGNSALLRKLPGSRSRRPTISERVPRASKPQVYLEADYNYSSAASLNHKRDSPWSDMQ